MIYFEKVTKTFKPDFWIKPFVALNNLSFHVEEGTVTGFLGANGAGKTTALKILMQFISSDHGEVKFSKKLGNNFNEIKSNIGYLPERPYYYPYLTGREFCYFMGELNSLDNEIIKEKVNYWSNCFNIKFALDRKIRGYSKGMLQRIGFVVTLMHDPELVVLDEPLSGLDPVGRKEVKDAILEIKKNGKTIFFSSHIVPDVQEVCDSVIFIEKGQLIYQGRIDKVIEEHIKPNYTIYFSLEKELEIESLQLETENNVTKMNENIYSLDVLTVNKDDMIKKLISAKVNIIKLEKNKLSLEEIFYKVRNITEVIN
jgi:ABC-2 type transport system ATP-binding protein